MTQRHTKITSRTSDAYARRNTRARAAGFASDKERRRYRAEARVMFGDRPTGSQLDEAAHFLRGYAGASTDAELQNLFDAFIESDEVVPADNFAWLLQIDRWRGGPDDPR